MITRLSLQQQVFAQIWENNLEFAQILRLGKCAELSTRIGNALYENLEAKAKKVEELYKKNTEQQFDTDAQQVLYVVGIKLE